MIVLIAGMQRSGSTYTFNVARELLEKTGSVCCVSSNNFNEAENQAVGFDNLIIKSHKPDRKMTEMIFKNRILCICTYRDPVEAIESWMTIFNFSFNSSFKSIFNWAVWHNKVSPHTLNIPFHEVDQTPYIVTTKISKYLLNSHRFLRSVQITNKYSKRRIIREFIKNNPDADSASHTNYSYFDKKTFFHRNHITRKSKECHHISLNMKQKNAVVNLFLKNKLTQYFNENNSYDGRF